MDFLVSLRDGIDALLWSLPWWTQFVLLGVVLLGLFARRRPAVDDESSDKAD